MYTTTTQVTDAATNTTVITNTYNRYEPPEDTTTDGEPPKFPGNPLTDIDDYGTPLGVEVILNHVGDCFD